MNTSIELSAGSSSMLMPPTGCTIDELRDTIRDIHRLAEKISVSLETEIQYNHQVFITLTDSIPDGLFITDYSGSIRVTSVKALSILNIREGGLNGASVSEVFPNIDKYVSGVSKDWRLCELLYEGKLVQVEVIVSRINLIGVYKRKSIPETIGANCIVLVRKPQVGQDLGSKAVHTNTAVVPTYSMYCDLNGMLLPGSEEVLNFLRGSSSLNGLTVRDVFNKDVSKTYSPEYEILNNVDVLYSNIEVAPMDIRDLVIYKSGITNDLGTRTERYSSMIFDVTPYSTVPIDDYVWKEYRHLNTDWFPAALVDIQYGKFLYVNKKFSSELDVDQKDLAGRHFGHILFGRQAFSAMVEEMRAQLGAGKIWESTFRVKRVPGTLLYTLRVEPIRDPALENTEARYGKIVLMPNDGKVPL